MGKSRDSTKSTGNTIGQEPKQGILSGRRRPFLPSDVAQSCYNDGWNPPTEPFPDRPYGRYGIQLIQACGMPFLSPAADTRDMGGPDDDYNAVSFRLTDFLGHEDVSLVDESLT